MAETVKILGSEKLEKLFDKLQRSDQRKIIRSGFREGARIIIKESRKNLRKAIKTESSGNLSKSIGFVAGRAKGKTVFVSAKVGARKFGNYKGYHGHLMDAGTTERQTRKGFNRGQMGASHFFTDAVNSTSQKVMAVSSSGIVTGLNKYISRNIKN